MRRLFSALALSALTVGTLIGTATAVQAQAADQTVTSTVKNHPDNGHGDPAHWADDTWTRTSTIHPNDDGSFTVHLAGKGTFKTVQDAGAPNGKGATIKHRVTGDFTEDLTATVTDAKMRHATGLNNINNKIYNDRRKVHFTTTEWIKHLFAKNGAGATVKVTSYTYSYDTGCQNWTDANDNNDGQARRAHNITGRVCKPADQGGGDFVPSTLTAAAVCHIKPGTRERWTLTRTSDNQRKITAVGWIYYPKSKYDASHGNDNPRDGWTYLGPISIPAGAASQPVVTPYGGGLSVHYWNGHGEMTKLWKTSNASKTC